MFESLRRIARSAKVANPRKRAVVMALHASGQIVLFPWSLRRPRRCEGGAAPTAAPAWPPRPRILLMRIDGVGDFIMTTALFPALRRAHPQGRIDLLCSTTVAGLAALFVRTGDIDHVLALPLLRAGWTRVRRLIARLRAGRYDVNIDLRGDFRTVLFGWLSGTPRRYGLDYGGFDFLLTDALAGGRIHQVEEVARIAACIGLPGLPHRPSLPLSPAAVTAAAEWLEDAGAGPLADARPVVALHVTAFQRAKLWPVERFLEVALHLVERHRARLLLIGGPDDVAEANRFNARLSEPAMIAAGRASLVETAALLGQCALFIGNDSGPAHIASAVDCRVISLFGPTDPNLWRPYTPLGRHLKASRPCDPRCNGKTCAVPDAHCMTSITVADVRAAADELLRGGEATQQLGQADPNTTTAATEPR